MTTPTIQLWEVFIRSRNGLAHRHVGSLHAPDATLALQSARDLYTRRGEGLSIWVVPSNAIVAEQINARSGLGQLMADARSYFRVEVMVLVIVIYATLGLLSYGFVRTLERRLLQWRRGFEGR